MFKLVQRVLSHGRCSILEGKFPADFPSGVEHIEHIERFPVLSTFGHSPNSLKILSMSPV